MPILYNPLLEQPESLGRQGLRILQPVQGFRFGQDSLLLAYFAAAHVKRKRIYNIWDFCAGSGVVGLLFMARLNVEQAILQGVEWHARTAERLAKNYALNFPGRSLAWCGDVSSSAVSWQKTTLNRHDDSLAPFLLKEKSADVILCNPPYAPDKSGQSAVHEPWTRVEMVGNLEGYLVQAGRFLSPGGELFICHRAERLPELLYYLESLQLRPKLLRFTQANPNSKPKLVLLKATQFEKRGGFTILPPLYTGKSPWNREMLELYGEEEYMSREELFRGLQRSE